MKRLIGTTTALSLVLASIQPWPLLAQTLTETGAVVAADGTVLCAPKDGKVCDPTDPKFVKKAQQIKNRMKQEAAAAKAAADQAKAEKAEKAKAEKAAAEKAKQEKAKAAAAAKAEREAAKAKEDAAKAEAEKAEDDATGTTKAQTEEQAQETAAKDAKAKAEKAKANKAKAEKAKAEKAKAEKAKKQAKAKAEAARAAAEAELQRNVDGALIDPAAGLRTETKPKGPRSVPVDAQVPTEQQVETVKALLGNPETADKATAAARTKVPKGKKPSEAVVSDSAVAVATATVTKDNARSSAQEFAAAPKEVSKGKKDGLSNLETFGLIALGALVVGTIVNDIDNKNDAAAREAREVVSNTGDRVVVLNPDGTYQVYKDDDAIIRQPGSTVRTETYNDGSTRTIITRDDGTQIVTIRDALGRVLRRAAYDQYGNEVVLIDDLEPETAIDVTTLPPSKPVQVAISTKDDDAALKAALAANDIAKLGRSFSLRQIREISEVRWLAPLIDVQPVTFETGSAAVLPSEAAELADLGRFMSDMIAENPGAMFLIEGHTDAVGNGAMNLALSDRRAESVALALTEYFGIPPENMVIQGYGETELLVDTPFENVQNRRVAVRIITQLLHNTPA